jgi:hypothetical protein
MFHVEHRDGESSDSHCSTWNNGQNLIPIVTSRQAGSQSFPLGCLMADAFLLKSVNQYNCMTLNSLGGCLAGVI